MITDKELKDAGGMIDSGDLHVQIMRDNPGLSSDDAWRLVKEAVHAAEDAKRQMSPANDLGITEHLNQRRLKYGIIDGAFKSMPMDDRIFIFQIDKVETETYIEAGKIIRPKSITDADIRQSFRGVLVAWGLKAQDELVPYDCRLGDIVEFIQMAPWKKWIGTLSAREQYVLVLRSGHIVGNEDAETRRRSGESKYIKAYVMVKDSDTVLVKHSLQGTFALVPDGKSYVAGVEKNQPMVLEEY